MAESWEEILDELRAPFADEDGYRRDEEIRFRDAAYEKRLDDVFGHLWHSQVSGSKSHYTITVEALGGTVTRTGRSFQDACCKFGIGRYLVLGED